MAPVATRGRLYHHTGVRPGVKPPGKEEDTRNNTVFHAHFLAVSKRWRERGSGVLGADFRRTGILARLTSSSDLAQVPADIKHVS